MPTQLNKALYNVSRDGKLSKLHDEDRVNRELDFKKEYDEKPVEYRNLKLALIQAQTLSIINTDKFKVFKESMAGQAPQGFDESAAVFDDCVVTTVNDDYRNVLSRLVENYPDERVCIHNPASRFQAFGAWVVGASAMEEQITRSSDILNYHKAGGRYPEDKIDQALYMTDVFFWRDAQANGYKPNISEREGKYERMEGFAIADVATAPSMDMRPRTRKPEWLVKEARLEEIRIRFENFVVKPAVARGVQHLVFCGAGCGAYGCDAREVAHVYAKVIKNYQSHFKTITGALFGHGLNEVFSAEFAKVFTKEAVNVEDVLAVGLVRPVTSPVESVEKKLRAERKSPGPTV